MSEDLDLTTAVFDVGTAVAMLEVLTMELDANAVWPYDQVPEIRKCRVYGLTDYEARAFDHVVEHVFETMRRLQEAHSAITKVLNARIRAHG